MTDCPGRTPEETPMTDDRIIEPGADRCPECGGYGYRGCGAAWHDGKPDTHCSPACQCRDEMRHGRDELRALVEQTRRERDAALDALLDIINVALGDPEDVVRLFGRDAAEAHRAVVEQADAIRRARAVPGAEEDQ